MGWTIFWVMAGILVVGLIYASVVGGAELEKHRADIDAKAKARREAFETDKAAYLEGKYDSEPMPCGVGAGVGVIGQTEGGVRILSWAKPSDHFIEGGYDPAESLTFTPKSDQSVLFNQIVEVAVSQDDVTETYIRTVSTPVAVAKKKSSIGRALVGGLLLGPAGAVVGAVSGAATTSQIKTVVTTQEDTRTVAGPPTLTLTVRGNPYSFERVTFSTMDEARSWGLWISDQRSASA